VDHRESRARTARPHRRHVGCAKVENDAEVGVWHRSPDVRGCRHQPPAVAQVDQQRAQEYFKEAEVQSRLQVARRTV
jgi:hypothetical protein